MVRVSIVIPCKEGEPSIALKGLAGQTFKDFEILIQREEGIARARNAGTARARGEYIAVNDSDDFSSPDRLEKEVAFLDSHSLYVAVGSWSFYKKKLKIIKSPKEVNGFSLFFKNPIQHSSVMIRWKDLYKAGGYSETAIYEDWDLWTRLEKRGKLGNIQESLVRIGAPVHTSSISFRSILKGEIQARMRVFGL